MPLSPEFVQFLAEGDITVDDYNSLSTAEKISAVAKFRTSAPVHPGNYLILWTLLYYLHRIFTYLYFLCVWWILFDDLFLWMTFYFITDYIYLFLTSYYFSSRKLDFLLYQTCGKHCLFGSLFSHLHHLKNRRGSMRKIFLRWFVVCIITIAL